MEEICSFSTSIPLSFPLAYESQMNASTSFFNFASNSIGGLGFTEPKANFSFIGRGNLDNIEIISGEILAVGMFLSSLSDKTTSAGLNTRVALSVKELPGARAGIHFVELRVLIQLATLLDAYEEAPACPEGNPNIRCMAGILLLVEPPPSEERKELTRKGIKSIFSLLLLLLLRGKGQNWSTILLSYPCAFNNL